MSEFSITPVYREVRALLQAIPAHAPGTGPVGDCYRTCVAALIGRTHAEDVPHFVQQRMDTGDGRWEDFRLARVWLRENENLDLAYITEKEAIERELPYLLTVQSKKGDWPHVVVAQIGRVLHDTSGGDYSTFERWDDGPVEILCEPYVPDPDELVRIWAEVSA